MNRPCNFRIPVLGFTLLVAGVLAARGTPPAQSTGTAAMAGTLFVGPGAYQSLSAALAACPSAGCTVIDNLPETWNTNPWASAAAGSYPDVRLGPGLWTTNVTLAFPGTLTGSGSSAGNGLNVPTIYTTIQTGSGFPAGSPVVHLTGTSSILQFMSIYCNGRTGSTGAYATDIQEQSGFISDIFFGCPTYGINVDGSAYVIEPAQSYIIRDVQVDGYIYGTNATVNIHLKGNGGGGPAEVHNVTSSGRVGYVVGYGLQCEAERSGVYTHLHSEQTHIAFGMVNSGCPGITITDVSAGAAVLGGQTIINIPNTVSLGLGLNFFQLDLEGASTLINCQACSPQVNTADPYVNWFTYGAGNSLMSSVADLGNAFNGGSTFLGGVVMDKTLNVTGKVTAPTVLLRTTVVASLPAPGGVAGQMQAVSDSTSVTTEGQVCKGGGTNHALAFSNGTSWKCF